MPSITQLQYILAVGRTGHFGRAAEECHVSQPSLSAQVQKAEEELGVIIFDRSKKPVMVTEQGKKVLEQSRRVLHEYKNIFTINQEGNELQGDFQLGVIPTLSPYIVPLFIERFSEKYPKVSLTINEYKTKDIIRKLYDDELDGGLLVTPLYDDRLIERSLFFEPFYLFCSEGHEFCNRKFVKDTDLDANSIWLLDEGHCFRDQVIRVCAMKDRKQVLPNVNFASGNLETLINLIRRGRGYTLLPHLATLHLAKKERRDLLKRFARPVPTREVSLVHSRSFLKEAIIEGLVSEIVAGLPEELHSLKRNQLSVVDI